MEYVVHLLTLVALFTILASSLDLLVGQAGMISLAHGAFFGMGAYVGAILASKHSAPFIAEIVAAVLAASLGSLCITILSIQLKGDRFVLATFGFQIIATSCFANLTTVTGGPFGIAAIPPISMGTLKVESSLGMLLLVVIICGLALLAIWRLTRCPFGRALRAVREDELWATAIGKEVVRLKMSACAVSASLAAIAGVYYAHFSTYIDPSTFSLMDSVMVLSMVIIGGSGSRFGALVGAAILVLLPEALRLIGLPISVASQVRQVVYGASLTAMAVARASGLLGRHPFRFGP